MLMDGSLRLSVIIFTPHISGIYEADMRQPTRIRVRESWKLEKNSKPHHPPWLYAWYILHKSLSPPYPANSHTMQPISQVPKPPLLHLSRRSDPSDPSKSPRHSPIQTPKSRPAAASSLLQLCTALTDLTWTQQDDQALSFLPTVTAPFFVPDMHMPLRATMLSRSPRRAPRRDP